MGKKNRPNSQANLIRQEGAPALGTIEINGGTNNPVGYYNPDKSKYEMIWGYYDFIQCCSRYVWDNLPEGYSSQLIERMLYFRASLVGFKLAGRLYILPYVATGNSLDLLGRPTRVKPIAYNGKEIAGSNDYINKNYSIDVDIFGDNDENKGVLLFDNIPTNNFGNVPSRYILNKVLIKEIADTFARININIVVSNKKILLQIKDAKQREVIRKELESIFSSDCPFGLITSPLESSAIQSTTDFNADELFNAIKNYDGIRCFMSGISSKGFGTEKKERLVAGELAGAEEEKDLVLDMGLMMRKEFCETINKKFGLNVSVRKRIDDYKEDLDGNGMNEEERENEL